MINQYNMEILETFLGMRGRLKAVILGLVRCRPTADDLVQDTFVRLWERKATLPEKLDVQGYFMRTGRNLAIDHQRRSRIAPFVDGVDHLEFIADPSPSPEGQAIAREQVRVLAKAIDQLPPRARAVFLMARLEGMTYMQIGEVLGVSPKTVFSHMVTALERISRVNPDNAQDR
jgi:RNA polymerase sigma-70 factor (ECF subfamily)